MSISRKRTSVFFTSQLPAGSSTNRSVVSHTGLRPVTTRVRFFAPAPSLPSVTSSTSAYVSECTSLPQPVLE